MQLNKLRRLFQVKKFNIYNILWYFTVFYTLKQKNLLQR
jgi:hypothetical protein